MDGSGKRLLTAEEVAAHNSRESCWIVIHGMFVSFESRVLQFFVPWEGQVLVLTRAP